jgi:hypothetical protein
MSTIDQVVNSQARIKILIGSRKDNYTTIGQLALKTALEYPDCYSEIICPHATQTAEIRDHMLRDLSAWSLLMRSPVQPHPRFIFRNGHTLEFRSFNRPENLRGNRCVLTIVSEAADIPFEQFQSIVLPKASVDGKMIIAGSIEEGSTSWLWQWYLKGQMTKNWASFGPHS